MPRKRISSVVRCAHQWHLVDYDRRLHVRGPYGAVRLHAECACGEGVVIDMTDLQAIALAYELTPKTLKTVTV